MTRHAKDRGGVAVQIRPSRAFGRRAPWSGASEDPARVRDIVLAACRRSDRPRRVVVLADPGTERAALAVLTEVPAAQRLLVLDGRGRDRTSHDVTVRHAEGLEATHRSVTRFGPVDVLVDLRRGDSERRFRRWRRLFFHLVDGGVYVLASPAGEESAVASLRPRLEALAALPDTAPRRRRPRLELGRAVGAVTRDGAALMVTKKHAHLVKVREDEVVGVVNARGTGLHASVLGHRDGGVLRPLRAHTSSPATVPRLLDELPYPPAVLRHYEGPVDLFPGMIARHAGVALPETFKWHLGANLSNRRLMDVDGGFGRLEPRRRPPQELEGSYYYLDYKNLGHYGHLLTEGVSKLWGWEQARSQDPDLKLLLRVRTRAPRRPRADLAILAAYGIDESDVVWVDRPVRVRSLVGATPMLHAKAPYHAHPDIAEVWARIRVGLLAQVPAPGQPGPRRFFVSRHGGNRTCRNAAEVESVFAAAGFEIVFPATLSLPQQAALFDGADVVAGFGGSGMFNLIYTSRSPQVIVLNHDAYDARNEHLVTAVLGSDIHYLWSPSDIRPSADGRPSYRAFQSSWAFDFEANGDALSGLLKQSG